MPNDRLSLDDPNFYQLLVDRFEEAETTLSCTLNEAFPYLREQMLEDRSAGLHDEQRRDHMTERAALLEQARYVYTLLERVNQECFALYSRALGFSWPQVPDGTVETRSGRQNVNDGNGS